MKKTVLLLSITFQVLNTYAEIWLPNIIGDNMVLQRNSSPVLWGWSTRHSDELSITCSWDNSNRKTKANQGRWAVNIPTPGPGGPYTITIQGVDNSITIQNVLIGDVWLCSGQSNMYWRASQGIDNAEEEIRNADYPNIRFFSVPKHVSTHPQDDTPGVWEVCSPESMMDFSAVGYFFGRSLSIALGIPIGLISSSYGGTAIEAWIPSEVYKSDVNHLVSMSLLTRRKLPKVPAFAFNAMIRPLVQFEITGAIWYQGEANRRNANTYYSSFPRLIASWRAYWNKILPFYYVQIAPYGYNEVLEPAIVRDAQLQTLNRIANTGMVVTNDIGDLENIHPPNKQEVGRRLALWALAKTYGVKDLDYSGPLYDGMTVSKGEITINFKYADGGLRKDGEQLTCFTIAGADREFHPAKAVIKGSSVVVSSKEVDDPVAVRFAFDNVAIHNLFNKAGLPASPFRTDNWELETN